MSRITFTNYDYNHDRWEIGEDYSLHFDVSVANPSRLPETESCTAMNGRRESTGLYTEETLSVTALEITEHQLQDWEAFERSCDCMQTIEVDFSDTCTPHWSREQQVTLESMDWQRVDECCEFDVNMTFRRATSQ